MVTYNPSVKLVLQFPCGGGGVGLVYSQGPYRGIRLQSWLLVLASEAESKEKHGVLDPMPELTKTSPYVRSRVDYNTFYHRKPYARVDFFPQSPVDACVR